MLVVIVQVMFGKRVRDGPHQPKPKATLPHRYLGRYVFCKLSTEPTKYLGNINHMNLKQLHRYAQEIQGNLPLCYPRPGLRWTGSK